MNIQKSLFKWFPLFLVLFLGWLVFTGFQPLKGLGLVDSFFLKGIFDFSASLIALFWIMTLAFAFLGARSQRGEWTGAAALYLYSCLVAGAPFQIFHIHSFFYASLPAFFPGLFLFSPSIIAAYLLYYQKIKNEVTLTLLLIGWALALSVIYTGNLGIFRFASLLTLSWLAWLALRRRKITVEASRVRFLLPLFFLVLLLPFLNGIFLKKLTRGGDYSSIPQEKKIYLKENSPFYLFRQGDHLHLRYRRRERDKMDEEILSFPLSEGFLKARRGVEASFFHHGSFHFFPLVWERAEYSYAHRLKKTDLGLVITGYLKGFPHRVPYQIFLAPRSNHEVILDISLGGKEGEKALWNQIELEMGTGSRNFYGLGTQFTHFNLQGHSFPVWVQEQGLGRGIEPFSTLVDLYSPGASGSAYTSYAPVPYFLTDSNWGMALENREYSVFDFRRPSRVSITLWSSHLRGRIYRGKATEIIESYTDLTGRMKPLPDWVGKGAIIRASGGEEAVREKVRKFRQARVPLAAVWIEDWVGERKTVTGNRLWWNWEADPDLYPHWEELIRDLKSQGIRVLCYFNPFVVKAEGKANKKRHFFEEARKRGFLVKNRDGNPYLIGMGGFEAALVDLTNHEARKWLKKIIQKQIDLGVSGWMADFGEALPLRVDLKGAKNPLHYHNQYPVEWARVNREAIRERGKEGEVIFFSRSGFTRSPGISPLFWLGDQSTTWDKKDGLQTVVPGLLSSGLSGFAINHSDIGGYLSVPYPIMGFRRSRELLWRWIELAALTPVFRTHETNLREENLQVDSEEKTLAHFARFARLYAALTPYRKMLMDDAVQKGLPLVRPLFLHFPQVSEAWQVDDHFLLGPDFLVRPVVRPGVREVQVFLPPGRWTHLWTGKDYLSAGKGKWLTLSAPLGEPPILYRSFSPWGKNLEKELSSIQSPSNQK